MPNLKSVKIDPKEVAYYEKLADTWWNLDGPFWPLHKLNALRIEWILTQLKIQNHKQQPLAGMKVLDIGCGGGILSESLAKQGAIVTAIDVVEKNIGVATAHAKQNGLQINYQLVSVEQMVETNQQFDIVFNMEVVEHVVDVNSFISGCNALVKPNGTQFIASINRNWLAFIIAIVGAEYVTGLLPKGTHHYNKLVKPAELIPLLHADGFELRSNTGVAVNPINRSMRLIKPTWVNYMLMAQKNRG
ncbi:bifunctional 2-polyprenyl-6-hydroxyphenol methylase/3-demethylubiquinol 3-O-methyltransferase UbiG [Paraglaciecola sp. MB-3u-78]|uniref:bifunctional 2-polyprenyl-6-hydroxyphenol methylase/3-demethylubiquinol 3-O-methyltransferase UbiG n=1 Tax=Paraglaciecola sp. MB-3u-78 TaxID=2058332 RepID=UPI000C33A2C1|nr:bifunctional 2-polyprenyl-6-hydroxyphenol methylase/3-demethylubiquinol 3-O-methyltransferase UbiG [Paraglaciecola sp. MB-3u-78]PKG99120.1 ubiquinone biosynthesis methyltransferase UbiE [Paraglaciecola sp. MB-3u-78]